jgi:type I restriction-modification system DNA methylase subunit
MTGTRMSILNASILFTRANTVRDQLDYISGHECISEEDQVVFNDLIRVLDKIYMSDNTREQRLYLQKFILLHANTIHQKYVELTNAVMLEDSYELKIGI